ncbi:MAG: phenylalanine--tRNA ligase subunit beta, partial [Lachnospiraceae bacterium]|nr:phenylalanine--tRNA ligase subunit beta [Lachnospiraceae bacterium]
GIMGGENSMITDDVKTVLFEAATFNGTNIRKSARRVGLRTDASSIFEKGLDANNAYDAMERACFLVEELGCGEVVGGRVDVYDSLPAEKKIEFEPERINHFLGTSIPADDMIAYLKRVEIEYDKDSNMLKCPTFRQDVMGFADISEEVARFYGYDKIPVTLPSSTETIGGLPYKLRIENLVKEVAESYGFSQGFCYSFESPAVFDKLRLPEDAKERQAITIANPLGVDFSIMRTLSLNGILSSLSTNFNRKNKDVRLYELGNIYIPESLPLTELPDERMQLTLGFYGEGDFYELKGLIEEIFAEAGMHERPHYDPDSKRPYLHPGRQADIIYAKEKVGFIGQVHPLTCKAYDMAKAEAYIAVLDMPKIVEKSTFDRKYTGIAKFPAVSRDLSMIVPYDVQAGSIEDMIIQRGGKILESCELFDIYQGDQIQAGFKSMAYKVVFRNKEKTLSDDEVGAALKKILNGLSSMGIELRS